MECEEFRDLLTFVSEQLSDRDIPHRTKVTEEIMKRYRLEKGNLKADMQVRPPLPTVCSGA